MLKPIFYKTNAGHYLVVKPDGSVIVEIDGQLRHFNEPADYRDFVHDQAQWLMIEDEKTIADLTKLFLLNVSSSTAREATIAPPLHEKTKSIWFTAITSREQALKVIKGAGIAFFVIAALLIPLGIFIIIIGWGLDFAVARGLDSLLTGVVSAALALWLILGKSRVAAVGLVILSCILVVSGIIAIFVIKAGGGGGGVVAVIALFAAAKAVEATFKLRGRFRTEPAKE